MSRADDLICLRYTRTVPRIRCAINLQPHGLIEEQSAFMRENSVSANTLQLVYDCRIEDSALSVTGNYTYRDAEFGGYARVVLGHSLPRGS